MNQHLPELGQALHGNPAAGSSCQSFRPISLKHSLLLSSSVQLKEMCRRELDKAESEIKKNSSIIGDYKQVGPCSLELGRVLWTPCSPG